MRNVDRFSGGMAPANSSADDPALHAKCLKAACDLQEHGWAVVEGVLPQEECDRYVSSLWDWIEGLGTGVDRNDPSTWGPDCFPPTYRGILNTLEVAHQAFVWHIRSHPRLVKVFELLWGTNELLTSFDAINVMGPNSEAPPPGWLHVDQAPMRPQLSSIQGIMNLSQVGPDITGTLMVKDKSYFAHQDFFYKASGLSQQQLDKIPDHYQFTAEQVPFWDRFESVGLAGGAGSLFLWDSRTVHSNIAPAVLKQWRHVVYACYQPRNMASPHDLELKAKAWREHSITTHLPAQNVRIYDAEFAKFYPNETKVMDAVEGAPQFKVTCDRDSIENSAIRRLAGIEPYPKEDIRTFTPLMQVPVEALRAQLNEA